MYQFFVDPSQILLDQKKVIITGDDVNHIKNVLRMKIGEEFNVSNGIDGKEYRCSVEELGDDQILCTLRFIKEDGVELPVKVTLFQGLPKADKMELIIQKAVELGVAEVVPVACKRCIVKLDAKKEKSKLARWQGIAEAAAKQSKRGFIPQVREVMNYKEAVAYAKDMECKLIPYEMAEDMSHTREVLGGIKPEDRVAIFIGPEGGFEEEEIQAALTEGIEPITLGKRILRTETAGFTVLSWLVYLLEK